MFPRNENRNEGTFRCSPERKPERGYEGTFAWSPGAKTRTRVHSPEPPFYKTALLSPSELQEQRDTPWAAAKGGVTNGGLRGVWPPFLEIGRNRPFSPFFCLFRRFPEGAKSAWETQISEEKGLFPQISSDLLKPPSLKPPCAALQTPSNTHVFGDTLGDTLHAGNSGPKGPLKPRTSLN